LKDFQLTYHRFSERSILVQWPQKIDKNVLDDVLLFKNHLLNLNTKQILQINNAYNSILVIYDTTIDNINDEYLTLKSQYSNRFKLNKPDLKLWKIPVCYDEEFGIDLQEMAHQKQCAKQDVIQLHSEAIYTVFFNGFLPGFLYLGGLDERLFFPRKNSPRLQVKKGSVAIGNNQTGIYPNSSPAGWNIIGNSPLDFFDVNSSTPCFANPGDKIQFVPISIVEHKRISAAVEDGSYNLENEIIYD